MTTSATLPSTTGPVHAGGFSIISEDTAASEPAFETPRPIKRCLIAPLTDSCKKRRKQATPVRISAADSDLVVPVEGKLSIASPEPELRCPLCQVTFNKNERLQNHIATEHATVQCKTEPEDAPPATSLERSETPIEMPAGSRSDLPWINDLQNKEWINPNLHGLPFSPATSLFMTLPPFTQPDSIPTRQPVRIFNPDAYCDLCNKEFCNKYFLKTHKANKHGIYTDPPTSETLPTSVNIPSYAANIKIPITSSSSSVDLASTTKTDPKSLNPFGDGFATNPNISNLFTTNKLFPKIAKPTIQGLYDQDTSDSLTISEYNQPSGLCNGQIERNIVVDDAIADDTSSPKAIIHDPMLLKSEFNFDEGTYFTSPSKMSPGQQSRELDLNRLRRLGVMNPKAFCEICCKEYCNKYFLRTHKMKRHGIFIPDESKDMKTEPNWSHNMQTSPLNLIMAEQNNSSTSERKTSSSPTDISCETCGIKFQNASLAQLHHVSVHSRISHAGQDLSEFCVDDIARMNAPDHQAGGEKSVNSAEAISEDLQKLQTMILQLNDLDVNRTVSTCQVCNKEFENRYYLHAHMMADHGLLVEESLDVDKNGIEGNSSNNNSVCDLCSKEVQSVDDMKKHLLECHPNHQNTTEIKEENFVTTEKGVVRANNSQFPDRRSSMSLTPSSSYCEICNKELCNKYFMKTHMQRMHGIEIENGAQIGGVICDICNKELCSKYFLRVHKHNTHGIVEYGSSLLQPRKSDAEPAPPLPAEPDPALKPGDLADLSHRYFTHFTEVCTICSRRFRSTKWLKAHLLSDHGQVGAEKWAELEQQLQQSMSQSSKTSGNAKTPQSERTSPTLKIPNGNQDSSKLGIQNVLSSIFGADEAAPKNYHCSYCPFSTPVLPFLFVHERSHSLQSAEGESTSLKCPVCNQNFGQTELLQHHMFTQHPFFPLPSFFNGNAESQTEIQIITPKEACDGVEEDFKSEEVVASPSPTTDASKQSQGIKTKKAKRKLNRFELSPDVVQSLKDVSKRSQLPATYALPQNGEQSTTSSYVMQAFLLDEPAVERTFVPSVVFLPVLQKQSTPITVTFTLTPA